MVVKRKPILRKAPARKAPARNAGAIEKQASMRRHLATLRQAMNRIDPGNNGGKISLDPREWGENGGFNGGDKGGDNLAYPAVPGANPNAPQMDDALRKFRDEQAVKFPQLPQKPNRPGGIQMDPREWGGNGGFQQTPLPQIPGGLSEQFAGFKDKFAQLPQKPNGPGDFHIDPRESGGFPTPMPGGGGMIRLDPREWGENGGFNPPQQKFAPMPGEDRAIRLDPREWGENGGFGKPGISKPMPPMPGSGGMIHLDPRERVGNGGFNQQPQKPNPFLGGGKTMPMPSPGRMPQPNPRRNLIPRPIDPRFKMM